MKTEVKKFLEEQTEKIRPLNISTNLACWDAAISGKKEDYKRSEELQLELEKIFHNKEDHGLYI